MLISSMLTCSCARLCALLLPLLSHFCVIARLSMSDCHKFCPHTYVFHKKTKATSLDVNIVVSVSFYTKCSWTSFFLLASMMSITEDGRWTVCQMSWPDAKLLLSMGALKWTYITAEDLPNIDPDILNLVSVSFPLCIPYTVLWEIFVKIFLWLA